VPSVAIFYMVMACNVPSVTELLDMLLILYLLLFCEMVTKEHSLYFPKREKRVVHIRGHWTEQASLHGP
jgi:hypothetical protein